MLLVILCYYSAVSAVSAAAVVVAAVLLLIAAAVVSCICSFHNRVNQYSKRFRVKCTIDNNNNSSNNNNNYNKHNWFGQKCYKTVHSTTTTIKQYTYIYTHPTHERMNEQTNESNVSRLYVYAHTVEKSGKKLVFRNFNWMNNMRDVGVYVCPLTHLLELSVCCLQVENS